MKFVLGDASSSSLVLDENGTLCGPGASFMNTGQNRSFGNPFSFTGSWTVQSATGQFRAIAIGTLGTDAIQAAGAAFSGMYGAT